jgi:hypothetical protein
MVHYPSDRLKAAIWRSPDERGGNSEMGTFKDLTREGEGIRSIIQEFAVGRFYVVRRLSGNYKLSKIVKKGVHI